LQDVFQRLAKQKEGVSDEGALLPDHVQRLITLPPHHSVARIVGFLQGKSSIWLAQHMANKPRHLAGQTFWARGYFVSTVGIHEKVVRASSEHQETEDRRLDDLVNRA
jgi:putative transposase